jgi:hypothetical protein
MITLLELGITDGVSVSLSLAVGYLAVRLNKCLEIGRGCFEYYLLTTCTAIIRCIVNFDHPVQ